MKCQKKDCEAEATCALALNVPAMNCPIAEHDPIRIVVALQLCARHLAETKPEEFFGADSQFEEIVRIQARNKAEPDFQRAFVTPVSFESDEWKVLNQDRNYP